MTEQIPIPVSVVIPVYIKADPEQFNDAIQSIRKQTVPVDEIIIVCDGPLTNELNEVIAAEEKCGGLTVVRFDENRGVGPASQAGVEKARNDWVAKQDSDDIAYSDRFAKQWALAQTGTAEVIGAAMTEFDTDITNILGVRKLPSTAEANAKYIRFNSPINNPTVLFKRDVILEVGGYKSLHMLEDYDLWARVISAGYRIVNIDGPLVYFRGGAQMLSRRADKQIFRSEIQLQRNLVAYGLISPLRAIFNVCIRNGARLIPKRLLGFIYKGLFYRGK